MNSIPIARGAAVERAAQGAARKSPGKDERRFDLAMCMAILGGESTPNANGAASGEASRGAARERTASWRPSDALQSSLVGASRESHANGRGTEAGDVGISGGAAGVVEASSSAGFLQDSAASKPSAEPTESAPAAVRPPALAAAAGAAVAAGLEKAAGPVAGIAAAVAESITGGSSAATTENIVGAGPSAARLKGVAAANPASPAAPVRPVVAPPRPSGVFVVPFPDGAGAEGRVRLVVRGSSVSATFLSSDRDALRRLGDGIADLKQALAERGFDDAQFTMRWVRPSEAGEPPAQTREEANRQSTRDSGGQTPERREERSSRRDRPESAFTIQSEVR